MRVKTGFVHDFFLFSDVLPEGLLQLGRVSVHFESRREREEVAAQPDQYVGLIIYFCACVFQPPVFVSRKFPLLL